MPNIYSWTIQPPAVIGTVDDITTVLTSPIRQYLTKIEWLDWNENTVGDYTLDVLDGNISVDASRDVRRTFSMTVNNTTGLYIPNGARTNLGVKVRLKRGIKTATGEVWWNKGIFVLTDPEMIDRGAEQTVNLQGVDKWALLNGDLGGTLTDTTVIPNGTNVAEAIMAVARDGGETKFAFDICTVMTPYTITKEPGTTRADLMKELALIPSWELFYDIDGYLRFRPIIDPLQKQIVVDLSSTSIYHKNLVETTYRPEWSKIRNYWKVIGYSDSTTGITYDGTAQDNNPESPTNTATPPAGIGVKAEVLTDDNLTTDDLCEQRAAYELRQNLRRIDRYTHSIIPLPFLQEGDCIQLDEGKMEIQAFSEPLGLGLMQLECWKAVSIFERVSSSTFDTGLDGWQQLQSGVIDVYGISGNNCMRKQTYDDPNGGYKLLDKKVIDFELILYTRRDSGTGLNAYSITDSSGNGYGITLDYSGNLTIDKRTAWARSVLKSTTVSPVLTNWYTLRLQKIGSNITAEVYDGKVIKFVTPLASTAVNDSSYTSFDRAAVNGGYVFFTDDVIVRKLL